MNDKKPKTRKVQVEEGKKAKTTELTWTGLP